MPSITQRSIPKAGVYIGNQLATGLYVGSKRIWPQAGVVAAALRAGALRFAPQGLLAAIGANIRVGAAPLAFAGKPLAVSIGAALEVSIGRGSLRLHGETAAVSSGVAAALRASELAFAGRALAVTAGQVIPVITGSLHFAPQALTTSFASGVTVDIKPGSLQITPKTPVPVLGSAFSGDMAAAALHVAGRALAVSAGASAAVGAGALGFHGEALAVTTARSASPALMPGVLTFAGAPLSVGAGASAAVGEGALVLTSQQLAVTVGGAAANPVRVRQGHLTQNTSSLVIPFDDGSAAVAGELLVASVRYSTNGQTPVAPGWGNPVITQPFLSGTAQAQALFVKTAAGGETGITVNMGASFLCSGTLSGWSNAKAGTATSGQFVVKGTGGTFGPSDTPVSPNAIPLMSFAFSGVSSQTFSSPWSAYPAANQLTMFAQEPAPGAPASGTASGPSLSATWINLWIEPK